MPCAFAFYISSWERKGSRFETITSTSSLLILNSFGPYLARLSFGACLKSIFKSMCPS